MFSAHLLFYAFKFSLMCFKIYLNTYGWLSFVYYTSISYLVSFDNVIISQKVAIASCPSYIWKYKKRTISIEVKETEPYFMFDVCQLNVNLADGLVSHFTFFFYLFGQMGT